MGTGGTTALVSPEVRAGLALEPHGRFAAFAATQAPTRNSGDDVDLSKNCRFFDIYIQEVKANV